MLEFSRVISLRMCKCMLRSKQVLAATAIKVTTVAAATAMTVMTVPAATAMTVMTARAARSWI